MKRLVVVIAVCLVGFAAAFVAFGDEARRACLVDVAEDPAYAAEFESTVQVAEPAHVLTVTHHGQPLSGTQVCINAELADRPGTSVSATARELDPGRFEVAVDFPRTGGWEGRVLVGPADATFEAAVPVTFEVTR